MALIDAEMTDKAEEGSSCLPARFWGLNPLFWAYIKMFVKQVQSLEEYSDYKGVYCSTKNQPVVRVSILGYIVSVDVREKLTTYGVDDGTGTMFCCWWYSAEEDKREVYNLGQLVTVKGTISVFRAQRQLTVDEMYLESDPNSEVLFWLEVVNLGNTVYNKPFKPSLEDLQAGNGEVSKEVELKEAILMHLMGNKMVAFQFRSLCLEPDIQHVAREAVKQKSADQEEAKKLDGAYEAKKVIRQSVKELENDGLVYFKDSRKDLYEVISHEHNLGPAILKAIRKISGPSGSSVSKWAIMDVLHSSHKFHYVTLQQVEDSLDRLLLNSDVYKQNENEYCLV